MVDKPSHFPDIWNDDQRMAVLFSPFRDKSLNPSSYDQKMSFWTDLIIDDCKICGELIVNLNTLSLRYQRKGKLPACLGQVVPELERRGKLVKMKSLNISKKGWVTWGFDTFVKSPLSWGWNYMKSSNSSSDCRFVVNEVLKDKCCKVCDNHYGSVECEVIDSVIEYNKLLEKNQAVCETEEEFMIVLHQLESEKTVMIHQVDAQMLIKFGRKDKNATPVSEQDLHVHRLKRTSDILMTRLEKLGHEVDRFTVEAKMYTRKEMKQNALRSLRQRRRIKTRMEKLTSSLDMLDDILGRIRHAVSDEVVLKAVQSGTSALKTLTDKIGLDQVTATMDNLEEALDHQNEIESELSMDASRLDTSDLEEELASLIGTETPSKEHLKSGDQNVKEARSDTVDDLADILSGMAFTSPEKPIPSVPVPSQQTPSNQVDNKMSSPGTTTASPGTVTASPPAITSILDDIEFPEVPNFSPESVSSPKERKTVEKIRVKELSS